MDYLSDPNHPAVLQRLTNEYLYPTSYEAYQWYHELTDDVRENQDLRKLYLIPQSKLLGYLDIFLKDGHQEAVRSLLEVYFEDPSLPEEILDIVHRIYTGNPQAPLDEKDQEAVEIFEKSFSEYLSFLLEEAILEDYQEVINYLGSLGVIDLSHTFIQAAAQGHLEVVKTILIDLKADLDTDNLNEALYEAAKGGHLETAKYLISEGADDLEGAFYWASKYLHEEVAEYFPTIRNLRTNGILYWMAQDGQLELVRHIIEQKGANDLNGALYWSAYGGHLEVVDYLLAKGATDVNRAIKGAEEGEQSAVIEHLKQRRRKNES